MCQEDETTGNGDPSCGEIDSSEEEECDPLDDTCPEYGPENGNQFEDYERIAASKAKAWKDAAAKAKAEAKRIKAARAKAE